MIDILPLLQIILIDIVLSGDNALVIALVCRNLESSHRKIAIAFGVLGAVVLRIFLTAIATHLFEYPYLKLVGAFLLIWIGIKLALPQNEELIVPSGKNLLYAAVMIIAADFFMSLDNVVAVAAVAGDSFVLLVFGLVFSIPLILISSQFLLSLLSRYHALMWLGAALLGFIGGKLAATDALLNQHLSFQYASELCGFLGALIVVLLAQILMKYRR